MKEKIMHHALRLFDKNGFHGTSIRDISNAAGCKMPTVYYYYESKARLFDEIVRVEYLNLYSELRGLLPKDLSPIEICIQSLLQRKALPEDKRLVHRLAFKTWLGFEGCDETRKKLIEWEASRYAYNQAFLSGIVKSPEWVSIIMRLYISLMQRIILFDEDISDDVIKEEITLVFKTAISAV